MRTYTCQAVLPNGIKCGKYAKHEEPDGLCLCEGCHRKWEDSGRKRLKLEAQLDCESGFKNREIYAYIPKIGFQNINTKHIKR